MESSGMRARVLFTIPNFITAGSGRAMMNIVERLDRSRFEPAVCVMRKGGNLDRLVEDLGIPLLEAGFTVPARPYATLPFRAWRAAKSFAAFKFDLWHSFHYLDDYTEPLIARLSGARAWIYTKKNMGWRRSWWLRSSLATRVAVQNRDILDHLLSPRLRNRSRLIPPSADTSIYCPDSEPVLRLREKLGISRETLVVACVAQLVPVKGHPTLLHSIHQTPGIHLFIAGRELDEEYTHKLHKLAQDLDIRDRVHFLGQVHNVPALLRESNVFVLPTWARWRMEGCPVALLEAMSCGLPCIASNVPGSRDVIEDGVNGLLVPPEDPRALAAAIGRLSQTKSLRQQLAQAARQTIVSHYGVAREVRQYEDLYSEILALN
jgi:glycosyltransferase involved in cell wall biosynthesis